MKTNITIILNHIFSILKIQDNPELGVTMIVSYNSLNMNIMDNSDDSSKALFDDLDKFLKSQNEVIVYDYSRIGITNCYSIKMLNA